MKKLSRFISALIAMALMMTAVFATFDIQEEVNMDVSVVYFEQIEELKNNNCTVVDGYKVYDTISVNGQEVRLFSEPTMSLQEALDNYSDAYEMCVTAAEVYGISTSIDDEEFQSFAKVYAAMNENGSSEFIQECKEFAVFVDYYENIEKNQDILEAVFADSVDTNIEELMPSSIQSTVAYGDVELEECEEPSEPTSTSYSTSAVVSYVSSWWNKTNNTDYPYHAEYYGLSTASNDYNDLDEGRSGQSTTRRNWSDCADFVSQCIVAGGISQINSGGLLAYRNSSNWYYSNSKPSYTWGGALNFFNHWSDRVGVASISSSLGVGDAVAIDIAGDGEAEHIVIIVSVTGTADSSKYLASHSYDRYLYYYSNGSLQNFTLSYLYSQGWTIYGFEIDTAS